MPQLSTENCFLLDTTISERTDSPYNSISSATTLDSATLHWIEWIVVLRFVILPVSLRFVELHSRTGRSRFLDFVLSRVAARCGWILWLVWTCFCPSPERSEKPYHGIKSSTIKDDRRKMEQQRWRLIPAICRRQQNSRATAVRYTAAVQ